MVRMRGQTVARLQSRQAAQEQTGAPQKPLDFQTPPVHRLGRRTGSPRTRPTAPCDRPGCVTVAESADQSPNAPGHELSYLILGLFAGSRRWSTSGAEAGIPSPSTIVHVAAAAAVESVVASATPQSVRSGISPEDVLAIPS
jgi:hypothetical protein